MESFNTGSGNTSPTELLRQGETWLKLWDYANDSVPSLLPAIYCLFSALELYLKAYIVLKDDSFASTAKLRKLGHNFNSLYEQFMKLAPTSASAELIKQLNKYRLAEIALDELKYPETGRMWSIDYGLDKGDHTLGPIFEQIESDVNSDIESWWQTKYPKKTEPGLLIQHDYAGDKSKISRSLVIDLSNTCTNCLPVGVVINETYNFPWHTQPIPARTCRICGIMFDPKGARSLKHAMP